jgi:hypothetical protein
MHDNFLVTTTKLRYADGFEEHDRSGILQKRQHQMKVGLLRIIFKGERKPENRKL